MDGATLLVGMFVVGLFGYFVPTLVAAGRLHPRRNAILAVNLLLGWTGLGWVAALVWACVGPAGAGAAERLCPHCAEPVKAAARVCKHCGRDLPAVVAAPGS